MQARQDFRHAPETKLNEKPRTQKTGSAGLVPQETGF